MTTNPIERRAHAIIDAIIASHPHPDHDALLDARDTLIDDLHAAPDIHLECDDDDEMMTMTDDAMRDALTRSIDAILACP
jgi:hypothetical protein